MSKFNTHLIIHQGALGDFILALRLAEKLPGPVVFAAQASRVRLINRFPAWGIKGIDIESPGFRDLYVTSAVNKDFTAFAQSINGLLVSFVASELDAWADNARRVFPNAKPVFIDPRPPVTSSCHVTTLQAAQLQEQASEIVTPHPRFVSAWKQEHNVGMVIHPGSGGAAKRWPLDRFKTLSQALKSQGLRVRWVVSPDDLEMDQGRGLKDHLSLFDGVVLESLDALADACLQADIWVGNDSGPTHLAGLLGTPTVALFGPTDPRVWAPVGERVRLITPQAGLQGAGLRGMDWLSVDQVLAEIRRTRLP